MKSQISWMSVCASGRRFTRGIQPLAHIAAQLLELGLPQSIFDLLRKPTYDEASIFNLKINMSTVLVSSKGQIVLPAEMRRRLGMGVGARIEVLEESDGLKLRVVRSVATADMTNMAGMVKAPSRGVPRSLADFDPASLLTRSRRGRS
jgi:AbrB family looped-hinge helix DNA binding protein